MQTRELQNAMGKLREIEVLLKCSFNCLEDQKINFKLFKFNITKIRDLCNTLIRPKQANYKQVIPNSKNGKLTFHEDLQKAEIANKKICQPYATGGKIVGNQTINSYDTRSEVEVSESYEAKISKRKNKKVLKTFNNFYLDFIRMKISIETFFFEFFWLIFVERKDQISRIEKGNRPIPN